MLWMQGEAEATSKPDQLTTHVTYPPAGNYGKRLQSFINDLRADTGVQVPFATELLRFRTAAQWGLGSEEGQPHNVEVVNSAMQTAANALESVYVVDGHQFINGSSTVDLPRYWEEPQRCVPHDIQTCLGPLWPLIGHRHAKMATCGAAAHRTLLPALPPTCTSRRGARLALGVRLQRHF